MIDVDGRVWSYDVKGGQGGCYPSELYARAVATTTRVAPLTLEHWSSRIPEAARGKVTMRTARGSDLGSGGCIAFAWDPQQTAF